MATMKDIAQRTGVSVATVSNVLNGKPGAASDSKAQEIFTIAQELHYRPNSFAKNLKLRRSNSIGIITEDLTVFNTPEIVDGIESYCEEHGYEIILDNMRLFKRYKNDFTDTPQHSRYFENALSTLVSKQVVPYDIALEPEDAGVDRVGNAFYGYMPDKLELLHKLSSVYMRTAMFEVLINSQASEHAARMSSMDNANRNARDMISSLTFKYNSLRQSAITTELTEIVAGAEAM